MRQRFVLVLAAVLSSPLFASQPLETETARLLRAGAIKIEAAAELQTSREGRERSWPLVFEYGVTDRTELTVEPVLSTSILPRAGSKARGVGDVEITLTHRLTTESGYAPAFAIAGEVKLPTARNRLIGTGKADYTGYAIASKRFDRLDVHANLGYTLVGRPAGTRLSNIVDYALAEEFHISPRFVVVSEIIGHTSATGETVEGPSMPVAGIPPEAASAENSILVGARYFLTPSLFLSLGVSYDNNHAVLVRPGFTYRFSR